MIPGTQLAEYEQAWLEGPPAPPPPEPQTDPFRIAWEECEQVAGDGVSIQTKRALKQLNDDLNGGGTAPAPEAPAAPPSGEPAKGQVGKTSVSSTERANLIKKLSGPPWNLTGKAAEERADAMLKAQGLQR